VTRTGGTDFAGSLSLETDEPMGVNHGVGFNRIEAGFSGPLAPRLTFAMAGSLSGQRAVEEGLDSQGTPIFLQAGVDTVIHQLSVPVDDPATLFDERLTADTTAVNVYNYAVSSRRQVRPIRTILMFSRSAGTSGLAATASACRPQRVPRYRSAAS
jgi:hypothetical protein